LRLRLSLLNPLRSGHEAIAPSVEVWTPGASHLEV